MLYRIFKRGFDFIAAVLLFVLISPVFIILMICVRLLIGKPIFFCQIRSGKNAKSFKLLKFRTMTTDIGEDGKLLPDNERLTKFGRFLRNSSLDELPELINIIKGDMAVIGPRPLYPRYNDFYTDEEKKRFHVRGGLIPPESIYHDSFVTWDSQLKYEAEYAENVSISLDFRIFVSVFKTIFVRNKREYGEYIRKPLDVERAAMCTKNKYV